MPQPMASKLIDVKNHFRSIDIDSFDPPSLQVSPTFADESVRGRSQPYRFYSDTPFRTWAVSLHLVASAQQADGGTIGNLERMLRFIMSFAYPEYQTDSDGIGGWVGPPHLAHLVLGKFLDSKGYLSDISTQLGSAYYEERPLSADVSFTFDELFDKPPSLDDIYSGHLVEGKF